MNFSVIHHELMIFFPICVFFFFCFCFLCCHPQKKRNAHFMFYAIVEQVHLHPFCQWYIKKKKYFTYTCSILSIPCTAAKHNSLDFRVIFIFIFGILLIHYKKLDFGVVELTWGKKSIFHQLLVCWCCCDIFPYAQFNFASFFCRFYCFRIWLLWGRKISGKSLPELRQWKICDGIFSLVFASHFDMTVFPRKRTVRRWKKYHTKNSKMTNKNFGWKFPKAMSSLFE